jgi:hypothetical protein
MAIYLTFNNARSGTEKAFSAAIYFRSALAYSASLLLFTMGKRMSLFSQIHSSKSVKLCEFE